MNWIKLSSPVPLYSHQYAHQESGAVLSIPICMKSLQEDIGQLSKVECTITVLHWDHKLQLTSLVPAEMAQFFPLNYQKLKSDGRFTVCQPTDLCWDKTNNICCILTYGIVCTFRSTTDVHTTLNYSESAASCTVCGYYLPLCLCCAKQSLEFSFSIFFVLHMKYICTQR